MAALNDGLHDRVLHYTYFQGPLLWPFFRLCEAATTKLSGLSYRSIVVLMFKVLVMLHKYIKRKKSGG